MRRLWQRQACLKDEKLDRASVRILIENNLLLKSSDTLQGFGEAVIPLSGSQDELQETSLLYLGFNCPKRQPNPEELRQSITNVQHAMRRDTASFKQIRARTLEQGYQLGISDFGERVNDEQVWSEMTSLYKRFGWNSEDVLDIHLEG